MQLSSSLLASIAFFAIQAAAAGGLRKLSIYSKSPITHFRRHLVMPHAVWDKDVRPPWHEDPAHAGPGHTTRVGLFVKQANAIRSQADAAQKLDLARNYAQKYAHDIGSTLGDQLTEAARVFDEVARKGK